jgi:predicted MPP superfamily phosphohydrolase
MLGQAHLSRRRKRRLLPAILAALLLLPLLLAAWGFLVEPRQLTVTRLTIRSEQVPPAWDGRLIAFFSDAHLGSTYPPARLARLEAAILAAKPDLILFGGDLIDHRTPDDTDFIAEASAYLAALQAPLGKYAVAGNHDNRLRAEYRLMSAILDAGGFTVLDNQSVVLDGLWLGGLAESYFGQPDVALTFSGAGLLAAPGAPSDLTEPLFRLLLMHQPDYAAGLPAGSADLVLSGHSHNGQVALLGRPLITVYQGSQYPYGLYELENGSRLVVSRGLGTVGLPVRFGAPPELVLITLQR